MKSGVVGMMPADPRDVDSAIARRIADAGYTGVTWKLLDPTAVTEEQLTRGRDILAEAGVRVAQANPDYEFLVSPEEERRREGVRALSRACRCARWLGTDNVYVRPGSMNPNGPWWPHPLNTHPRTIERLITSLKEVAPAAEDEGVALALEGHVLSPLETVGRVREVIAAVGSPALKFNADPVNFVGTLKDAYQNQGLIDEMFDTMGDRIVCAHIKDVRVEERFVLHLTECVLGDGLMDLELFLRRFQAACPSGFVMIEHLPAPDIPRAKSFLDSALSRAGLAWSR